MVFVYIGLGALIIAFLSWFLYRQNNDLGVSVFEIESPKIHKETRWVQLSDLHTKDFGGKLLVRTAELRPDGIFMTGDIIGRTSKNYEKMFSLVKGLVGVAPVFYVCGNHDYSRPTGEREAILARLRDCGAIVLQHGVENLSVRGDDFIIAGVDDCGYRMKTEEFLANVEKMEGYRILLSHFPQYFPDVYSRYELDLIFTGHTHGGQFILPGIGGLYGPGQGIRPKYFRGIYKENLGKMIVSRGLGNSGFPFRLFNKPEIILARVVPEENKRA